jgi:hypothetical protein
MDRQEPPIHRLGETAQNTGSAWINPPTQADMASQLEKLDTLAGQNYQFALVAHSQGAHGSPKPDPN